MFDRWVVGGLVSVFVLVYYICDFFGFKLINWITDELFSNVITWSNVEL